MIINNKEGKEAFETMVITIGIVTAFLAVILWFVSWINSETEQTRFKHETCMVETVTHTLNNTITVIQYCGPNNEGATK